MDASSFRDAVFRVHDHGRQRGHYFLSAQNSKFVNRHIHVSGRDLLSFGSCSYLGLEFDPRLIRGGAEGFERYGSQTSYSRGYLSCPLYEELEQDLFPRIFDVPRALLLPSTSIAHHVVMPAILSEQDAIVLDHQVHRSVDDAITLQCARSHATKIVVKHGELDKALDTLADLAKRHQQVWFACDGVYSMYGDILPAGFLHAVLNVAPNVNLYVDDAHGMSWAGMHGRGHFLSRFPLSERVIVVTSLAKAFATGGGVVLCKDPTLLDKARLVGGPYSFSGPLRPGDLGSSIASARIHLSDEIDLLQGTLRARVEQANRLCRELEIPLVIENEAPIFFVALGRVEAVYLMAEKLRDDGFHVNVSGFPAVPASRGGLRVAVNAIHTESEIDTLFRTIAHHMPEVLGAVGVTPEEVAEQFRDVLPPFLRGTGRQLVLNPPKRQAAAELKAETYTTIQDVPRQEWDTLVGPLSYVNSSSMAAAERVFHAGNEKPEYRWAFRYVMIRDRSGEVVAAAPFTTSLMKDDTFMNTDISVALEGARLTSPYLFTSRAVVMGSMASEGAHLYLKPGATRRNALVRMAELAVDEMVAQKCSTLVLRDFGDDPEIQEVLVGQGFVPVPLVESYALKLDWKGDEAFVQQLDDATRRRHVKTVQEQSQHFAVEVWDHARNTSFEEVKQLHDLYMSLARKNLRINIFPMPAELLAEQLKDSTWEVVVIRHKAGGPPVAWGACRNTGDAYKWLYCGVDYTSRIPSATNDEISPYRQLMWQVIRRAASHGCTEVNLGMGTRREKTRFGAVPRAVFAYVRADDAYHNTEIAEYVTKLAIERARSATANRTVSHPSRATLV